MPHKLRFFREMKTYTKITQFQTKRMNTLVLFQAEKAGT